jgi:two-component system NtrC family response regulator
VKHLPREIARAPRDVIAEFELPDKGISLAQLEKDLINQALKKTGGNQVRAAKLLGITRHALRHRMKKHDIRSPYL